MIELSKIENKKVFQRHLSLARKFVESQKKVNAYLEFRKWSMKKIDTEIWEYIRKDKSWAINTFQRTNPSGELDEKFRDCMESLSMRLQDTARLCLYIVDEQSLITKSNLVTTYEKRLREIYAGNSSILECLDSDSDRILMLKELRNEAWRHEDGDKNGARKLVFHPVKIEFIHWENKKPTLQIPTFDFIGSKWIIRINDFDRFFETLTHNIFDVCIDWLIFAYAYKSNMNPWILKSLHEWREIKDS